jgi:hypothetical protein
MRFRKTLRDTSRRLWPFHKFKKDTLSAVPTNNTVSKSQDRPSTPPPLPRLLSLPGEIRTRIYEYVLSSLLIFSIKLLQICTTIRHEALKDFCKVLRHRNSLERRAWDRCALECQGFPPISACRELKAEMLDCNLSGKRLCHFAETAGQGVFSDEQMEEFTFWRTCDHELLYYFEKEEDDPAPSRASYTASERARLARMLEEAASERDNGSNDEAWPASLF